MPRSEILNQPYAEVEYLNISLYTGVQTWIFEFIWGSMRGWISGFFSITPENKLH